MGGATGGQVHGHQRLCAGSKKLTIDCGGFLFGRKVMETSGWLAISIKDDIGEYSVKWEGKWGAENWGF